MKLDRLVIRGGVVGENGASTAAYTADERQNQNDPRDESADMRPKRDAARGRLAERGEAEKELLDKPPADHKHRGHIDRPKENEKRKQDIHTRPGVQNKVCAEHASNRAARADGGDAVRSDDNRLGNARYNPARKIEKEIDEMPKDIFDVISKDPQKQHVAEDVRPTGVQELGGNQRFPNVKRGLHGMGERK